MKRSPIHGLECDESVPLDWNLIYSVERCINGSDIHDGRALLCMYRDAAEMLSRKPNSMYAVSKKAKAETLLRELLANQITVTQAYKEKQAWWYSEGERLFGRQVQGENYNEI